jgi:hypothetical protein
MSEHRWIALDRESFSRIRTLGGEKTDILQDYADGMAQCAGCGCVSGGEPHGFMLSHNVELLERAEGNPLCFEIVVECDR